MNEQRGIDITGRQFDYLTALRPTDERKWKYVVWECRCQCGNLKRVVSSKLLTGRAVSCGCRRRRGGSFARFNRRFVIDSSGCWLWTGQRRSTDDQRTKHCLLEYGAFWLDGRYITAHRAAYLFHVGPIPEGMCVLHRCDVPNCVNPDHLWLGTQAENVADMVEKGRHKNGPRRSSVA